ncbi:MAG: DUF3368 domain-containing protein [Coleofasciculaceae cyanobacterium SM2_1_6]|nr:DUF3368 domain-containing protein [Coleofasciculaceae cyanobacterium SM2_1_6]
MFIVSDTSPISNLAKVGQLHLMFQLYGKVLIPNAVHEELLDPRAGETVIIAVQLADWLEVRSVQNQELVNALRTRINIGEAEAIALAVEVQATRLIIDERLGRQAAKDFKVKITGVLGLLLLAKRRQKILAIKPIMDNLIDRANFRISPQLYADVLQSAHE